MKKRITRRKFVKSSVMGLGGAAVLAGKELLGQEKAEKTSENAPKQLKIKKYNTYGITGFKVSRLYWIPVPTISIQLKVIRTNRPLVKPFRTGIENLSLSAPSLK